MAINNAAAVNADTETDDKGHVIGPGESLDGFVDGVDKDGTQITHHSGTQAEDNLVEMVKKTVENTPNIQGIINACRTTSAETKDAEFLRYAIEIIENTAWDGETVNTDSPYLPEAVKTWFKGLPPTGEGLTQATVTAALCKNP